MAERLGRDVFNGGADIVRTFSPDLALPAFQKKGADLIGPFRSFLKSIPDIWQWFAVC